MTVTHLDEVLEVGSATVLATMQSILLITGI
jgi:hypothetical protein